MDFKTMEFSYKLFFVGFFVGLFYNFMFTSSDCLEGLAIED